VRAEVTCRKSISADSLDVERTGAVCARQPVCLCFRIPLCRCHLYDVNTPPIVREREREGEGERMMPRSCGESLEKQRFLLPREARAASKEKTFCY